MAKEFFRMQLLKKNGIILFWALLFIDCYFIFVNKLHLHTYTKVLLMPVLMFYIFLNAKRKKFQRSKTIVFVAFLSAWVGDILLLKAGDSFFISGMIFFLITHLAYIVFFYRANPITETKTYDNLIIATIIVAGLVFAFHSTIKYSLQAYKTFKYPVYIYMVVIGTMAILAGNLYGNRSKKSLAINFFIPGAFLFMVSDAALAFFKFRYTDVEFLAVIVMLTYGYAQCLFAQGFTKYFRS